VDVSAGLPGFSIVGLPDAAVQEARERVRVAISNSGFKFPTRKVIVNLAPANLRKEGAAFYLPIALGILAVSGEVPPERLDGLAAVGELSLDGNLRGTRGALSMSEGAFTEGIPTILLPASNAREAAATGKVEVFGTKSLRESVEFLRGEVELRAAEPEDGANEGAFDVFADDFADVSGQGYAKRALEVAASGGHNLLMSGPPGSGKTMLARRLPGVLPPLSLSESIEATKVHSAAGEGNGSLLRERPFRAPHHTISTSGLAGGRSRSRITACFSSTSSRSSAGRPSKFSGSRFRGEGRAESSAMIRERVVAARERQIARQGVPNSALAGRRLREICALGDDSEALLSHAIDRMGLSGRAHDRVLRVARTIADLVGEESIAVEHLAESLNYRRSSLADG
jgi:magnesium chelatase family protein